MGGFGRYAKKMKRYPTLMILAAVIVLPSPMVADGLNSNEYRSIHWCYFNKQKYAFGVSDQLYEKMTKWNLESDDPPPTSAQKAYNLAKERLDKIEIKKGFVWDLEQVALEPVGDQKGKWIWKVSFRYAVAEGGSTGRWPTMDFLVTMDGELIEPVISDHKR